MPPFASDQFRAITSATPECVWNALTATGFPLDYLHGMTVDTPVLCGLVKHLERGPSSPSEKAR